MWNYPPYVFQGYNNNNSCTAFYNANYIQTPQKKRKCDALEEGFLSLSLESKESIESKEIKEREIKDDIEMSPDFNNFDNFNYQEIPYRIPDHNPMKNIKCNNIVIAHFNNGIVENQNKGMNDLNSLLTSLNFENSKREPSLNPLQDPTTIKNQKMIMPPSSLHTPQKRNRDEECTPLFIGIKDQSNGFKIVPCDIKTIKKLTKKEKRKDCHESFGKYIQVENLYELRAELNCLKKRIIETHNLIKALDQQILWNNHQIRGMNNSINGYPNARNCYIYARIWYDERLQSNKRKLLENLFKRKRFLESQLNQQYVAI